MGPAALLLAIALAISGCQKTVSSARTNNTSPTTGSAGPITATNPAPDNSGDWVRPARDYSSTRFSPLDQINTENVKQLVVKTTFSTGVLHGHEAAPIVANNTMYVVTPYPNLVYALDLSKDGAPVKWKYEPKTLAAAQGVACCDVVNRGVSYADGTIFLNTLDNRTIALDAATGEEKWVSKLGDLNRGETITMAPLVVKDKVLVESGG
jgi:lanthanide-dependent methanol dehydrogenase